MSPSRIACCALLAVVALTAGCISEEIPVSQYELGYEQGLLAVESSDNDWSVESAAWWSNPEELYPTFHNQSPEWQSGYRQGIQDASTR